MGGYSSNKSQINRTSWYGLDSSLSRLGRVVGSCERASNFLIVQSSLLGACDPIKSILRPAGCHFLIFRLQEAVLHTSNRGALKKRNEFSRFL